MPEFSQHEYLVFVIACGIASAACFVAAFVFWHRVRLIEDTPTSRIRSAHQGYIEIIGQADKLGHEPLLAPITLTPCVWYRYKVEERHSYEANNKQVYPWVTVQDGVSEEMFLLDDGSGKCIIDPEGARVTPAWRRVWYGNSSSTWTTLPRKPGLLSRLGVGRYRFTEERIHCGDEMYAIGQFNSISGHDDMPNKETAVRELLREWKKRETDLLERFDANHDGRIDLHEWEQVRAAARAQVDQEYNETLALPQYHIMNKPLSARQPFILSGKSQEHLLSRYRWLALASFAGFLGGGALAIWAFQNHVINY